MNFRPLGLAPFLIVIVIKFNDYYNKFNDYYNSMITIISLLSPRGSGDHETSQQVKSIFMTKWDGLNTSESKFLVIGATNLASRNYTF